MPKKIDPKKITRAEELLAQKKSFAETREILQKEFGEGLSMTTLAELNKKSPTIGIPSIETTKAIQAGKRLYSIFASHFKQFKQHLNSDEKKIMNEIAEVLENA